MIYPFWRLSEDTPCNLGLACTDDGLLLGRTPLIERRDGRFVVRERGEIERLLKRAYLDEPPVDRLMSGLATVASALNANDQCLARIAAVHLRIPDLPSLAARDALTAEDSLIKYTRDEGGGASDWNSALHPRAAVPPNPGWFTPTDGRHDESSQDESSHGESRVRFAASEDNSRRSGAPPTSDVPITLQPGHPNGERANFADRFGFSDRRGGSEFWSKVWPAIRNWLQEPVPEHDIDTGEVVGERPRWQAIAPYVGIPIATAAIFGLEAYAPAIAAWLGLGGGAAELGAEAGIAGPRFLGSFPVPKDLKFGTTKFGDYAHEAIVKLLQRLYPDANFIFRVGRGQIGPDVEVEQEWINAVRFRYGEIKPLTASGQSRFNQQVLNWELSEPVKPITYDAAGNVLLGFH
jgi:hypothetical protein